MSNMARTVKGNSNSCLILLIVIKLIMRCATFIKIFLKKCVPNSAVRSEDVLKNTAANCAYSERTFKV